MVLDVLPRLAHGQVAEEVSGAIVEANVVIGKVGVDVRGHSADALDSVDGGAVDLGVELDVTGFDRVRRRGGVGDHLLDDAVEVRFAEVVGGVGLEVDLLPGDALVEEVGTTGDGRMVV